MDEKESKALAFWRVEIAGQTSRSVVVFARSGRLGSAADEGNGSRTAICRQIHNASNMRESMWEDHHKVI